jgi:5-methylthioribose kinase
MAAMLMQKGLIDCVVVGADRVTKFGYTANKIGTYSFAVLAKQHNIPFYVACPTSTIDMAITYGREIEIEERPADEMRKIGNQQIAPKQIPVFNPSFDVTPPSLIEAIVTEKGLFEFDRNSGAWEEFHYDHPDKLRKFLWNNKHITQEYSKITYIGDGNLNYVWCVRGENEVICVKQALPWCKCVGTHFPLSLKRTLFETEALKFHNKVCPGLAPKLHYYNEDLSLFIMEFLDDHDILRAGMIRGQTYENVGKLTGEFVAKTSFYSGTHHLSPEVIRDKISFWNQNTLCKLTEQVVFSDPYVTAELNRWTSPQLDKINTEFKSDSELILKAYQLRQQFILNKQALIHADLHSGSIMVNTSGSSKVIDGEFSFYGPIGYDAGNVISHFLISYISHKAQGNNNKKYFEWINNEVIEFWKSFEQNYFQLWSNKELRYSELPGLVEQKPEIFDLIKYDFLKGVFRDTLGFAGMEIIRRIIGVAHVADFETIQDKDLRGIAEIIALNFARRLIVEPEKFRTVEDVVEALSLSI